jgi:hypothetical protein
MPNGTISSVAPWWHRKAVSGNLGNITIWAKAPGLIPNHIDIWKLSRDQPKPPNKTKGRKRKKADYLEKMSLRGLPQY